MSPFDAIIWVAGGNTFKPHVATYTKAAEIMGVRPAISEGVLYFRTGKSLIAIGG